MPGSLNKGPIGCYPVTIYIMKVYNSDKYKKPTAGSKAGKAEWGTLSKNDRAVMR